MPCNSDYLKASSREVELSRVACLLDELDGRPIDRGYWSGHHPAVYNKQSDGDDAMVALLCERLQTVDVKQYSLEMQIWWRDHQAADKARLERQISDATHRRQREEALAKLTPYERALLGV